MLKTSLNLTQFSYMAYLTHLFFLYHRNATCKIVNSGHSGRVRVNVLKVMGSIQLKRGKGFFREVTIVLVMQLKLWTAKTRFLNVSTVALCVERFNYAILLYLILRQTTTVANI